MEYYYLPQPPYVLLFAGFLMSVACGAAFEAVLKQSVQLWSKNRSTRNLAAMQGFQLFFPFLGICIGSCVFLSSGMTIFGFPAQLGYLISVPLMAFIGWLIWWQLGKILQQLEEGGSKALDLDSFY
jgi:uncharacterized protein (DUF2062 family)